MRERDFPGTPGTDLVQRTKFYAEGMRDDDVSKIHQLHVTGLSSLKTLYDKHKDRYILAWDRGQNLVCASMQERIEQSRHVAQQAIRTRCAAILWCLSLDHRLSH